MAAAFMRLDFIRNPETKQFSWRFHSTNGIELSRSSETYARRGGAVASAWATLALGRIPDRDGIYLRRGYDEQTLPTAANAVQVRFLLKARKAVPDPIVDLEAFQSTSTDASSYVTVPTVDDVDLEGAPV